MRPHYIISLLAFSSAVLIFAIIPSMQTNLKRRALQSSNQYNQTCSIDANNNTNCITNQQVCNLNNQMIMICMSNQTTCQTTNSTQYNMSYCIINLNTNVTNMTSNIMTSNVTSQLSSTTNITGGINNSTNITFYCTTDQQNSNMLDCIQSTVTTNTVYANTANQSPQIQVINSTILCKTQPTQNFNQTIANSNTTNCSLVNTTSNPNSFSNTTINTTISNFSSPSCNLNQIPNPINSTWPGNSSNVCTILMQSNLTTTVNSTYNSTSFYNTSYTFNSTLNYTTCVILTNFTALLNVTTWTNYTCTNYTTNCQNISSLMCTTTNTTPIITTSLNYTAYNIVNNSLVCANYVIALQNATNNQTQSCACATSLICINAKMNVRNATQQQVLYCSTCAAATQIRNQAVVKMNSICKVSKTGTKCQNASNQSTAAWLNQKSQCQVR